MVTVNPTIMKKNYLIEKGGLDVEYQRQLAIFQAVQARPHQVPPPERQLMKRMISRPPVHGLCQVLTQLPAALCCIMTRPATAAISQVTKPYLQN